MKQMFGRIVFKNYKYNSFMSVYFSNIMYGKCMVCLVPEKILSVYQNCGHVVTCFQCSLKITNSKCIVCRQETIYCEI